MATQKYTEAANAVTHTPGPWRYGGNNSGKIYEPRSGCHIATVAPNQFPTVDQEANARLISAAPEMLEALKGLVGLIVDMKVPVYSSGEIYAAERAIAKAERRGA